MTLYPYNVRKMNIKTGNHLKIISLCFLAGLFFICFSTTALNNHTINLEKKMNIKIVFDSNAIEKNFQTGWGFSCLINNHILFDTGEDGKALVNNLHLLGIKSSKINKIIISHNHYDHIDGLWKILAQQKNIDVYVCPAFDSNIKTKITNSGSNPIDSEAFQKIDKDIFTTGELAGLYKGNPMPEQALILKTTKGLVIITGCAHPGIIKIIATVKKHFHKENIYLVMGGFHLNKTPKKEIEKIVTEFKLLQVQKVAPLHCSGDLARKIFQQHYGDNCLSLKVGESLET